MRQMLSYCPALRILNCQIPMATRFVYVDNAARVTQPVSPRELNNVFEPVRQILRQLTLLEYRYNVPYDGSHMDLSNFPVLTDLNIASCCVLPPGGPCEERNAFHNLLPPNLRYLRLEFSQASGIFYHHQEGDAFRYQDPNAIPRERYIWICELIQHKSVSFPRLEAVEMKDPPGNIGPWCWLKCPWSVSKDVVQVCADFDVKLEVELSYPNPDSGKKWGQDKVYKRRAQFLWGI
ncbi:hypothetical protein BDW02DRAFT_416254 [Decorospora gaudefroyi]|uniref:Uncharacterized protein n=1 Tax=Decorospora gaudefroyi TaxID=184978 RepID=A0A6A5K628_9PLEO|nr:hypothetical protein BDW02DRAFT_416254 [Decorospora gaudefroyi]